MRRHRFAEQREPDQSFRRKLWTASSAAGCPRTWRPLFEPICGNTMNLKNFSDLIIRMRPRPMTHATIERRQCWRRTGKFGSPHPRTIVRRHQTDRSVSANYYLGRPLVDVTPVRVQQRKMAEPGSGHYLRGDANRAAATSTPPSSLRRPWHRPVSPPRPRRPSSCPRAHGRVAR